MNKVIDHSLVNKLRISIDPERKWLTDDELVNIVRISGCMPQRAITRCFLGIQQKARKVGDSEAVMWARNQLVKYEVGFLQLLDVTTATKA